jgi:hypothetical protein
VTVDQLREILSQYPGYLKVHVALPDGTGEIQPTGDGFMIDHQTYGWLTFDSEDAR